MRFANLFGFVTAIWTMILAEVAFLVFLVPLLDRILLKNGYSRPIISSLEAFISISSVLILIFILNRMKNVYLQKKLKL